MNELFEFTWEQYDRVKEFIWDYEFEYVNKNFALLLRQAKEIDIDEPIYSGNDRWEVLVYHYLHNRFPEEIDALHYIISE